MKRKFRIILSVVLTLTMVMGMSLSAFALDTPITGFDVTITPITRENLADLPFDSISITPGEIEVHIAFYVFYDANKDFICLAAQGGMYGDMNMDPISPPDFNTVEYVMAVSYVEYNNNEGDFAENLTVTVNNSSPIRRITEPFTYNYMETAYDTISDDEPDVFIMFSLSSAPGSDPSESEEQGYYLDPLEDMLDNAITSGNAETIKWNAGDALPNNIMQKLFNNPSLSLDFKFTYEGVEHEVFIGPGQAVNDNTPWYGPLCLLKLYGEKKDTPVANGEYTVVSGDTLNDIAKRFGTTVDDLMAKNPDIKDRNMIYPGDVIKY